MLERVTSSQELLEGGLDLSLLSGSGSRTEPVRPSPEPVLSWYVTPLAGPALMCSWDCPPEQLTRSAKPDIGSLPRRRVPASFPPQRSRLCSTQSSGSPPWVQTASGLHEMERCGCHHLPGNTSCCLTKRGCLPCAGRREV